MLENGSDSDQVGESFRPNGRLIQTKRAGYSDQTGVPAGMNEKPSYYAFENKNRTC